jgi:hypothetical protein
LDTTSSAGKIYDSLLGPRCERGEILFTLAGCKLFWNRYFRGEDYCILATSFSSTRFWGAQIFIRINEARKGFRYS